MDDKKKKCCETCRFGVKVGGGTISRYIGCQRFPPAAEFASPLAYYGASKFPLLDLDAFCSEWTAKIEGEKLPEGNFMTDTDC